MYNLVFVCLKYITIEQEVFLHMPGAELQKARGGTSLPVRDVRPVVHMAVGVGGGWKPVAGHSHSCMMGGKPWWSGEMEARRSD